MEKALGEGVSLAVNAFYELSNLIDVVEFGDIFDLRGVGKDEILLESLPPLAFLSNFGKFKKFTNKFTTFPG